MLLDIDNVFSADEVISLSEASNTAMEDIKEEKK